ncbi:hypothetical protein Cgig2_013649 [Carnegiea gigantea]|uniref:DNA repair metallo-beta-lactamase domain-containing protein n=1 Tax=Carnegiea gigantea TaxID=171969 RepID=A0A9Q1JVY3_9CARY|nr:hypothetical protein Cgig2_013649 [Carnegiea gigantea]
MFDSANQIGIDEDDAFSEYSNWKSLNADFPEEEGSPICLNENEFSLLQSNEEEGEEHSLPDGLIKSNFAADFYQSGTDWSSLRVNSSSDPMKLKQTNLFQMWGLKRHRGVGEEEENEDKKNKKIKENATQLLVLPSVKSNSDEKSLPCPSNSLRASTRSLDLVASQKIKLLSRQARACPFYKKIPGTTFTVDAFRYGAVKDCSAYFLSHFHADHYGGLSKTWSYGPIYCTPITARLVRMCLSVNPSLYLVSMVLYVLYLESVCCACFYEPTFIFPLELDVEHVINDIKVMLLEANHCPGAAMIHFHLPDGRCYLHTGDFRACNRMQAYSALVNKHVNVLYLDTTYCNPRYRFPSKEEVLSFVVRTTKACLKRQPRTLIIVGAYRIGNECVYIAISEALKVKIYANASRRRFLQSFEWPQLSESLCLNGKDTPLHVLPISSLRHEMSKNYLETYKEQFTAVLAFCPTGWTFSESVGSQLDLIKPNSKGNFQIYGVPYSEHSSFSEMQEFVQFLKPDKIIPTVNISSAANREKLQSYFRQ